MNRWVAVVVLVALALAASSASRATPQHFPGTWRYYDVIVDQAGLS